MGLKKEKREDRRRENIDEKIKMKKKWNTIIWRQREKRKKEETEREVREKST